ncbi:MAG: DUF4390 domain-containing protein [Betaproteobacteria bacterium]|jgi:hypothetical protein|nr:DUF4390 domain-containing protein [Betaproteobacteria bacterium]NBO94464.1 DUF4390 domain-containing protein [Betaproteobacteria bacterium]NBP35367.1 DUF4390 domain-containing protein [Betaproteobacteria bacterium]NBP37992.1 DUF4390 domain-containing protein [Betaproteobacteria bacterium]NBQ78385.1 DUF4390 domain-containing protein [Betaproteobacteria bacterium]
MKLKLIRRRPLKCVSRCYPRKQARKNIFASALLRAALLLTLAGGHNMAYAAGQDNQPGQESAGSPTSGATGPSSGSSATGQPGAQSVGPPSGSGSQPSGALNGAATTGIQVVLTPASDPVSVDQGIEVTQAVLRQAPGRDDYWLSADLSVLLNPTLTDAVNRGVPLYFVLEAELLKPRWYWTDERLISKARIYRLHYHAITRQYRLQSLSASSLAPSGPGLSLTNPSSWLAPLGFGSGASTPTAQAAQTAGLYQAFASLREALQAMGRVRSWPLTENIRLQAGQSYELRLRMRLDASQLPRPLQIPGISQRDWSIEGAWKRFLFEIGTKKSAP